VTSIN